MLRLVIIQVFQKYNRRHLGKAIQWLLVVAGDHLEVSSKKEREDNQQSHDDPRHKKAIGDRKPKDMSDHFSLQTYMNTTAHT